MTDPITTSVQAAIDSDGVDDAAVVEAIEQGMNDAGEKWMDEHPLDAWEDVPIGVLARAALAAYKRHMEMF